MINKKSKVFVAGHNGMIGSAILRKLQELKYKKIYTIDSNKLDLRDQSKVYKYLKKIKPNAVIIAAAKVGGIKANNTQKADFIFDNLSIQNNLIHGSFKVGVKNLIFLAEREHTKNRLIIGAVVKLGARLNHVGVRTQIPLQ